MRRAPKTTTISPEFKKFISIKVSAPWWARLAGRILEWELNFLIWMADHTSIEVEWERPMAERKAGS